MSEPLWRWPELCAALGVPVVDGPDIGGISIDSRRTEPGDLFIALTGDPGPRFNPSQRSQRDGHDYITSALGNGAAGVMSHDSQPRGCPELKVVETLDGLWALGRAARARLRCPVIAITGSSGKTTTKTLLARALDAFATPGSLNNHLGVPLSLARTPRDAAAAVFEIGTNHPGEIAPLSDLVRPQVAVLLNVHPAHAENFRDMEELRKEKILIINGLENNSKFVVEDLISLEGVPADLPTISFGRSEAAAVRLLAVTDSTARFEMNNQRFDAHIPGGGAHRALSLAAVIGVLTALDRDLTTALTLPDELIPEGRGNRRQAAGITLVDDSYNANPASMAAALKTLAAEPGRKFALLGEMLELGDASEAAHRSLAAECRGFDGVYCVGSGMLPLAQALGVEVYPNPDEKLLGALTSVLRPGDTLLVKGSNRVFWTSDFVGRLYKALIS